MDGAGLAPPPSAAAGGTLALGVPCMLGALVVLRALLALGLRCSMLNSSFPEAEPAKGAAG